jgi:predicted P-loop ATPase
MSDNLDRALLPSPRAFYEGECGKLSRLSLQLDSRPPYRRTWTGTDIPMSETEKHRIRECLKRIDSKPTPIDAKLSTLPAPDVKELMIVTVAHKPKTCLANAITALRYAPEWWGVLGFNEFSLYTVTKKPAPWQQSSGGNWSDYDDSRAAEWLQHFGILVSSKVAGEAAQTVAHENRFHPVRDYLQSLQWDQKSRIDTWLTTYLSIPNTSYSRAVGRRWLISGVARILRPGCQVDHTLLIEGSQGAKKSSALRALVGDEWFTDHISDLGSKDSRIELHGKWVIEMSELQAVKGKALETVKAFLTARIDHFRAPWDRRASDHPRSCIFAGSTNSETPLTDETGNRRFWPVRCGELGIDQRDRDQLWAEAYKCYQGGSVWWLETRELDALARQEQDERYDPGVWDEVILQWIDDPKQRYEADGGQPIQPFTSTAERVTISDILVHCIRKPLDRHMQADKNQVARCLVHDGWTRKQWTRKQEEGGLKRGDWFYVRPTKSEPPKPAPKPDTERTLPSCPKCESFAIYRDGSCQTCGYRGVQ